MSMTNLTLLASVSKKKNASGRKCSNNMLLHNQRKRIQFCQRHGVKNKDMFVDFIMSAFLFLSLQMFLYSNKYIMCPVCIAKGTSLLTTLQL